MGTLPSKESRRVSFDNTFAIVPAINIQKSITNQNAVEIEEIVHSDLSEDVLFKDKKLIEQPEDECDGDYWAHRIDCLKKEHQSINRIIETHYENTVENTNNTYEQPKVTHERLQRIKPCFDWRTKILRCYEDNPHQPLVCSSIVQAFSQCVSSCRREI